MYGPSIYYFDQAVMEIDGEVKKTCDLEEPSTNISPAATITSPSDGSAFDVDETINFQGSGSDTDGSVVSYQWNIGDGSTSTQQNPSHSYSSAGTYTVTLTVTDDDGATGATSIGVTVNEGFSDPTIVGSVDTPGSAWGVYVSGSFAYVADGSSGLRVIDISNS